MFFHASDFQRLVRVFCLTILFSLSLLPSPVPAREFSSPEEEWKTWQSLYHRHRAAKETDPARRAEWLQKPLLPKEIRVDAVNSLHPEKAISHYRGFAKERCVTCHDGIEETGAAHPLNYGCTVCHGGNPGTLVKAEAHRGLLAGPGEPGNPSDLRVADQTCGLPFCHAGHEAPDRNDVRRVKKSIMATNAGEIAALRYLWGAQPDIEARYSSFGVEDLDGNLGALSRLKTLPFFAQKDVIDPAIPVSGRIADSRWRKSCDPCHLWGSGGTGAGGTHAAGCAACHVPHRGRGFYEGGDPTIPGDRPGHMRFHRITASVSDATCLVCHREMSPAGKFRGTLPHADIHRERGMTCMDCHTASEVMGDHDIHSRERDELEVRCRTCHGDGGSYPHTEPITDPRDRTIRANRLHPGLHNRVGDLLAVSSKGNKLVNVKKVGGTMILISKRDGKTREIPLLKDRPGVHSFPPHEGKLECGSCHSRWSVEIDYGNGVYDQRGTQRDKFFPEGPKTRGRWTSWEPGIRAIPPRLIVDAGGRIATAILRRGFFLTALDAYGKPLVALDEGGGPLGYYKNWAFSGPGGFAAGFLLEAGTPHSTAGQGRSCQSCHLNPSALSIGSGDFRFGRDPSGKEDRVFFLPDMAKSGSPVNFPPEVKGTVRGEQIGVSSQPGVRAFNRAEITKILKAGICVVCHDRYEDPIYQDLDKSYAWYETAEHGARVRGMQEGDR